jgi:c(7)-type cytochrome triheme protein
MTRGLYGPALIAVAGLLAACQDNPARPDTPAAEPPDVRATPDTATMPAPSPGQAEARIGAPHEDTADELGEPAPRDQPAPTARPKPRPAGKPRLSAKSAAYDRRGTAYSLLQAPRSALGNFPADTLGGVDWVAALKQGLIEPRADVSGTGVMRRRDDAIIMRNTLDMPWVRFPHAEHTEWLDCSNCHPHPFEAKTGSSEITMDSIMRGRHCGLCHDRVAFSIFACERCHSVTHPGSPAAWW